jgi:hypothetical protein
MKLRQKVRTPHGIGHIAAIEIFKKQKRYGVVYEKIEEKLPKKMHDFDVIYYLEEELELLEK